ncbi:MAG TPA: hypothetical protein VM032_20110 [Vicinamibacterales bacterium]|nr:hypothetical protein [Vicinamibacterales bacterium]
MHAVVVTVNITPGQFETSRKALHEQVVPRVSGAPGFVKGYWTANADRSQGTSLIVFHTRENAERAASMIRTAPPTPGVTLGGVEVREVVAEA